MRHFERREWLISEGQRDVTQGRERERKQRQLNNCHLHKNIVVHFLLRKVRKAAFIEGSVLREIK